MNAFGPSSNFCGLSAIWAHLAPDTVVRDVNCFTVAGAPISNGFLVSDDSRI